MEIHLWALLSAFVGAAVVTWLLTPLVAGLAKRLGVLDFPGGRRVHREPTPRLGGLALLGGLGTGALIYGLAWGWDALWDVLSRGELASLLLCAALVCAVGVVDDVRGLSPGPRIAAEAVAASFLIQGGYVIDVVANPLGPPVELGLFAYPITLVWFVGVTNAFNLIDGLDGLLSSVSLCALLGVAAIALLGQRPGSAIVALAMSGALLGFLRWNWAPARIFLGDSGSLLIGFTIAALSIKVARNPFGTLAVHVPLLLCAIPLVETSLTLARRYVSGAPYLTGDRSHIHHVLLTKGWSVRRAVASMAGVSALFSAMAFLSRSWREEGALLALLVLGVLALVALRWLGYVELSVVWDRMIGALSRSRRPGMPLSLALARTGARVRGATDIEQLLEALCQAVRLVPGLRFIAVEFAPGVDVAARVEVQNRSARAFASSRRTQATTLWLLSHTADELTTSIMATIRCSFPLPMSDGHLGTLVCEQEFEPPTRGLREEDVVRYLAEPLGEQLLRLVLRRSVAPVLPEHE